MDPVGKILGNTPPRLKYYDKTLNKAKRVLKTKGYTNVELDKMEHQRIFEIALSISGYEKE